MERVRYLATFRAEVRSSLGEGHERVPDDNNLLVMQRFRTQPWVEPVGSNPSRWLLTPAGREIARHKSSSAGGDRRKAGQ